MTTLALFARYKEIVDTYNQVVNPAKSARPKSKLSFLGLGYFGHGKTGRARAAQFQTEILDTANEKNDLEFLRDVFNFAYSNKFSSDFVKNILAQVEKDVEKDLPRTMVTDYSQGSAWGGGVGIKTKRQEYNSEYYVRMQAYLNTSPLQMKTLSHP